MDEHDRVTAKIVDIVEDAVAVSNAQSGKIEELKNALGNTQGELAQANGRVSECNVEIGHLKKDMLGLGKELTEAKSLIATQQKDIDKMVEHSNEAKTKLFEAKAELRDLESTRDKLAQANDLVKEYKNHFAALETILGDELTDDNNLVEFVKETNLKATKKTIEAFILKHMLDQAKAETLELKKRIHHALIVSIVVLAIFLTPWVPAHGFARFVVGLLVLLLSWDHFLN